MSECRVEVERHFICKCCGQFLFSSETARHYDECVVPTYNRLNEKFRSELNKADTNTEVER